MKTAMAIVAPFKPDKPGGVLPLVALIKGSVYRLVEAVADAAMAGRMATVGASSTQSSMPRAMVPANQAAMRCDYRG